MYYLELLQALAKDQIEYLLVGGLAVNLYGIPRVTQDIDLILETNDANLDKMIKCLKELKYIPRLPGTKHEDLKDPQKMAEWINNRNLTAFSFYNQEEPFKEIDIIISYPLEFAKSFQNRTIKKLNDIEINLIPMEDLITMKKISGREQDLSDIKLLEKIKEFLK